MDSAEDVARRYASAVVHISRLKLENIRCFAELDLPLGRQWNVIVGPNGTGKTTVLRAIASVFGGSSDGGIRGARSPSESWLRRGSTAGHVVIDVGGRLPFDIPANNVGYSSVTPGRSVFYGAVPSGWLVIGIGAVRANEAPRGEPKLPSESKHGNLRARVRSLAGLYAWPAERTEQLYDWIRWEDFVRLKAEKQESHRPSVIRSLARALDTLFAGYARFREVSTRGEILFDTDDGLVDLENLADGLRSVFVIVAELVLRLDAANERSVDPLSERALCLIDELDAHLHPRMQRTVLPALRQCFPNVQFIVTTHSPYVVGSAEPGEVVALRRVPGGAVQAFTDLPDVRGWTADQIATSEIFGLDTTRDIRGEAALERERELLSKGKPLTPAEKKKLSEARALLDAADGPMTAMVRKLIATPPSTPRKTTATKSKRRVARKRRSAG